MWRAAPPSFVRPSRAFPGPRARGWLAQAPSWPRNGEPPGTTPVRALPDRALDAEEPDARAFVVRPPGRRGAMAVAATAWLRVDSPTPIRLHAGASGAFEVSFDGRAIGGRDSAGPWMDDTVSLDAGVVAPGVHRVTVRVVDDDTPAWTLRVTDGWDRLPATVCRATPESASTGSFAACVEAEPAPPERRWCTRDVGVCTALTRWLGSPWAPPGCAVRDMDNLGVRDPRARAAIEGRVARVRAAMQGPCDDRFLDAEAAWLDRAASRLAQGADPWADVAGNTVRGYRSTVDEQLHTYALHVPAGPTPPNGWPMVVALHGLHGSAGRMLATVLGHWDASESPEHAERHLPDPPTVHALVLSPEAFGDTNYRSLGEQDVLDTIADVRGAYRVDPSRITITGVSMGGSGAATLAFRHPDLFAAAAPLCGYHDWFLRSDTQDVRQPWEIALMEMRSNVHWAWNGRTIPLHIVHGTRDRPLANSGSLVARYRSLDYRVRVEWPDLGHDVWSTTYAGGAMVEELAAMPRRTVPRAIRFRSPGMRWRRMDWIEFDGFEARGRWGEVEAETSATRLHITTRGLTGLTVVRTALPSGTEPRAVEIDGTRLALEASGETWSFTRDGEGRWRAGRLPPQPVGGPLRDAFDGPTLFVWGTQRGDESETDRRVARRFAAHRGVHVGWRAIPDTALTEDDIRTHTIVLVGTPAGNPWIARWASRWPFRVEGRSVVMGARRWDGSIGALAVVAHPDDPRRTLIVLTGTDAASIRRHRALPELVPDWVIHDERVSPARGRSILGRGASVLAAGFLGTSAQPVPEAPR